ncbi:MAG: YraN family protein [Parvibaculales bacterium]
MAALHKKQADTYVRGLAAESLAAWLLRIKGWRILERRWSCHQGEVDVIARKGDLVIFVEVKYRATIQSALDALTRAQWQRIEAAAEVYMTRFAKLPGCSWRFDAVCVTPWAVPRHFEGAWS